MKIVFAAKDGFEYNRVKVLHAGLEGLTDCSVTLFKLPGRNKSTGQQLLEISKDADAVYVPPFRHRDLPFVRKYSSAPVVFDPLISRYLTKVIDYKQYHKAPQKWFIDYRDFRNCDLLLADTDAHLQYFKKTFFLPKRLKTLVLPVGVNTEVFKPNYSQIVHKPAKFKIGFYGSFVPLQGALKIIHCAALLAQMGQEVEFEIIGTGHQYQEALDLAKKFNLNNITFKGWLKYDDLAEAINTYDLCLGIFGDSLKADLVVPNKIYHYAAMAKPILTKDSPSMRHYFKNEENIFLCKAEPVDMAEKITLLLNQASTLSSVAKKARSLMLEKYSHKVLAQSFIEAIRSL
jgi:glycosyltransferase involved in cell wall biosynthesis